MGRNPFRVVVIYMSPLYAQSTINHFGYLPRKSSVVQVLLKEKKYIEFFTRQSCPTNLVKEYLQRKTNAFST